MEIERNGFKECSVLAMMSKEEQQLMEACLDNSSEPTVVLKLRDNLPM